ncbi:MAG: lipoprotein [Gammaproteobacteria bacterium]|nr:lipoprotein [Gammaproteobacteria bacterium]NNC97956.1 lipoprotein [Gammaproteobacteria bacterium]NNM13781.1 lipoprotein [Gammaproteobacteria bacterium]
MTRVQKYFAVFGALFGSLMLLGACGLKGDLYLPESKPQIVDSSQNDNAISQEETPADSSSNRQETEQTSTPPQ